MILHVFFLFPAFTVIVAFPFFFAFTTPFPFTDATFLSEDLYVSFATFFGVAFALMLHFLPFFRVFFFGTPVIFFTWTLASPVTWMVLDSSKTPHFAVILAVPAFVQALITPFLSTEAIFLSPDVQDFTESPFAIVTFTALEDCFF